MTAIHAPALVAGNDLAEWEIEPLTAIGYGAEASHSASCVIVDQEVRHITRVDEDVEILPLAVALRTYDWVQDLMFSLIPPDYDEHVREAAESPVEPVGHFIWVHDGAEVTLPVQSFTLLETPQQRQFIHNITVIGRDASLTTLSGSAVTTHVRTGHHVSISESFLGAGAEHRSVSIERWGADMDVHSYSRSQIGAGARDYATNIALSTLKNHHADGATTVEAGGSSRDQSVIFAPTGTHRLMESEIVLAGEGASAESLARMVTDGGTIENRSRLVGDAHGVRGYLGCDGLKLTDDGELASAPSLVARTADAQLSHEASIGMISQEKVTYLMASGMTEEEARSLIVSGFMELDEELVPAAYRREVKELVAAAKSGAM